MFPYVMCGTSALDAPYPFAGDRRVSETGLEHTERPDKPDSSDCQAEGGL